MQRDVANWINNCDRCVKSKKTAERTELVNIQTSQPLELVCMDYLTLEPSKGGIQNILVITDHFTKFSIAVPTRNQTARVTAEAIFNNFILFYGIPEKLHSDQGTNFCSKIVKELCSILGIYKSRTTPYHPMGNGVTERFNRTLLSMLGTLENSQKANWKSYINTLVHAYNSTVNDTTGFSPFYLMFGREPKLPVDVIFGLSRPYDEDKCTTKYIEKMKLRLQEAYRQARTATKSSKNRQKSNYDLRARAATLGIGDRVLVKIVSYDGKHKIADKWEDNPYIIISQPNEDIPVFKVRREDGEGRCKVLHRNLLLPIGTKFPIARPTPPTPKPRKGKEQRKDKDDISDTDSEFSFAGYPVMRRNSPQNSSSQHDDDHALTREASDADSEEDALHQDVPEDQPEEEDDEEPSTEDVEEPSIVDDETSIVDDESSTADDEIPTADENTFIADEDHSTADDEPQLDIERPVPAPRRSGRERKAPNWTKDYVMMAQGKPDWLQRATFLRGIMKDRHFDNVNSSVYQMAMLNIVSSLQ